MTSQNEEEMVPIFKDIHELLHYLNICPNWKEVLCTE